MVSPECAPVVQAGGLGDVVFGLSRELEIRGNAVEIILPKYDQMRYDRIWQLTLDYRDLWVPWYGGAIHCAVRDLQIPWNAQPAGLLHRT